MVDNKVQTNIPITNKKQDIKKANKKVTMEFYDRPDQAQTKSKIKNFEQNLHKDATYIDKFQHDDDAEEENLMDKIDEYTDKKIIIQRYNCN